MKAKKGASAGSATVPAQRDLLSKLLETLNTLIKEIPQSDQKEALDPRAAAREIITRASVKAATISGSLALPPGPAGWLTIFPDLIAVWHVQRQMVSDIASVYGKQTQLSSEAMLYCLFRHAAAQAVRDLVTRVGERILVRRPTFRVIQSVLQKIGLKITQRLAGTGIARMLPIIGAVGVAGYTYYDTGQVGQTAIDFFESQIKQRKRKSPPVTDRKVKRPGAKSKELKKRFPRASRPPRTSRLKYKKTS